MLQEASAHTILDYTVDQWEPLFSLIPEIESTKEFGQFCGGELNENGVRTMPYMQESDIVTKFHQLVYALPIMIVFDWGSWSEGKDMLSDNAFDFDTVDIITKCKLITMLVRNDRFCEGALVSAFKSGLILRILKSLRRSIL